MTILDKNHIDIESERQKALKSKEDLIENFEKLYIYEDF